MKANILRLKNDIKALAANQKENKNQRKTVNFKGVRNLSPENATELVQFDRVNLNRMYTVYARLRNKPDWESLLSKRDDEMFGLDIKGIYKKYEETVCDNS